MPTRIAGVLRELDERIAAGSGSRPAALRLLGYSSRDVFRSVAGATRCETGRFLHWLLTRFKVLSVQRLDICSRVRGRGSAPPSIGLRRHALRVCDQRARPSSGASDPRLCARRSGCPLPTILMGDINEWFLWGGRALGTAFQAYAVRRLPPRARLCPRSGVGSRARSCATSRHTAAREIASAPSSPASRTLLRRRRRTAEC